MSLSIENSTHSKMNPTAPVTSATPKPSFAKMVQQEKVPTREQAIVIDSIEGYSIQDYAVSLASITGPKNITHVSRISHGRVCFYLNSKDIVTKLLENKTKINIGDNALEIRPLISQAKRIIISNVQPCIPNSVIEHELRALDISPASPVSSIRAGVNISEMGHILSFRKQVYINPDDLDKIPAHLQIAHQGAKFWIYLSAEKLVCYQCKEEGHLAKYCKNLDSCTQIILPNEEQITTAANTETQVQQNRPQTEKSPNAAPITGFKRPLSSTSSSPSQTEEPNNQLKATEEKSNKVNRPKSKKIKNRSTFNAEEYAVKLQPAKNFIEQHINKYSISFDNLLKFLENSFGKSNVVEIALNYISDIDLFDDLFSEIYTLVTDSSLKRRITRFRKIFKSTDIISSDDFTDDSHYTD